MHKDLLVNKSLVRVGDNRKKDREMRRMSKTAVSRWWRIREEGRVKPVKGMGETVK
jgi:hypothetical protein